MVRSTLTAEQRRHVLVLFAGALPPAQRGARDHQRQRRHQRDRHDQDEDLQVAEGDDVVALAHDLEAAADDLLHRLVARALQQLDVVLQEDRHADGGDQRGQARRSSQRTIGDPLEGPAIGGGQQHRCDEDQQQRERNPGHPDEAQHEEGNDRDEGADHEDLAMREIDHADDAVDQGVADGDQAVDGAEGDAVDGLVDEVLESAQHVRPPCPDAPVKRVRARPSPPRPDAAGAIDGHGDERDAAGGGTNCSLKRANANRRRARNGNRRMVVGGAPGRIRTCDPRIRNPSNPGHSPV